VIITPRQGILDPQGEAVERTLPTIGFAGVAEVRIGKVVDMEVPDGADVEAMCRQLLANPLIEDWEVVER
jgi:phosphoribosylformylglycinamidine synthase